MSKKKRLSKFEMSVLERAAIRRVAWGSYVAQGIERKQRDVLKHGKTPEFHQVLIG